MIEIENLNQSFGNRHILRDVNLQINNEETLVILGASGSGKSTLLKLIIGLIKPTSGKIFINGKDITLMNEDALNEQRIHMGMVFQYSALFDSMSVKENIAFGIKVGEKLNQCKSNAALLLPIRGISMNDKAGSKYYGPKEDQALFITLKKVINNPLVEIIDVNAHINEEAFAISAAKNLIALMEMKKK